MSELLTSMKLTFSSPDLERQYSVHRTTTTFFLVDKYSALFRAGVPVILLVQLVKAEAPLPPIVMCALAAAATLLSVLFSHMKAWQRQALRFREPLAVILRSRYPTIGVDAALRKELVCRNCPRR